jgi:hypothetical protein
LDKIPGDHHDEIREIRNVEKLGARRYYAIAIRKLERQEHEPQFKGYTPATFEQHVSACLQIMRAAIDKPYLEFYAFLTVYLTQEEFNTEYKHTVEILKDTAIHDLYEYLDEQLDGINAVNGILRKYKQNAEWFQKQHLQQVATEHEGKKGERSLALHLQQYVFDQGVEFVVEPSSASGEVDLLLRDPSGQFTIIDAKYIKAKDDGSVDRSYVVRKIAEGFTQVMRYCEDYNQSIGFLGVFINADVAIHIELEENYDFRYFKIGGKSIYYTEINIAERPSASKAGKANEISISHEDLANEIQEIQNN